ncbi:hypothetical protein ABZ801_34645 [Actinomadura sp. NPDC047616]|uniref:hypothetical protein n=1 Tax=Actinomadura sp. NPDC047616 TaxID=3155914 RepID=UPI0033C34EA2
MTAISAASRCGSVWWNADARALLAQPDAAIASIARLLDVSRATSYEYVPGSPSAEAICPPPQVRTMSRSPGR